MKIAGKWRCRVLLNFSQRAYFSGPLIVTKFDIPLGLYSFEVKNFETTAHSHPAVEIMHALEGHFDLSIDGNSPERRTFAIVEANQKHQVWANNCRLQLLMVEQRDDFIRSHFAKANREAKQRHERRMNFESPSLKLLTQLSELLEEPTTLNVYDQRIAEVLKYLQTHELSYVAMLPTLCDLTSLSESRLTHLFKAQMGISLKKYLLWCKLKSTIAFHLQGTDDLFGALIRSGFYDQPHFSRSFRDFLGVAPSKAYDSRTLQVLP